MQKDGTRNDNPAMIDSESILETYLDSFSRLHRSSVPRDSSSLPRMKDIRKLEDTLLSLFFPGEYITEAPDSLKSAVKNSLENTINLLESTISKAIKYENPDTDISDCNAYAEEIALKTAREAASIRQLLKSDAEAGFEGDPAAKSLHEVILCYPALRTLAVHRVAHFLYQNGVPLIPRMMSEAVHSRTGIDIHPGATIGESFFIDHGTGVVIGETTIIGKHVKLYQGVTLGALSIPKKGCGQLLEGAKRHPTIEDNVTIYANATILGDITIGHDTIIASNAWIKENIPHDSIVITALPEIKVRPRRKA